MSLESSTPVRKSMIITIRRIAEAKARLHLRGEVTEEDINFGFAMHNISRDHFQMEQFMGILNAGNNHNTVDRIVERLGIDL